MITKEDIESLPESMMYFIRINSEFFKLPPNGKSNLDKKHLASRFIVYFLRGKNVESHLNVDIDEILTLEQMRKDYPDELL